ncbi:hypothetical protein IGK38_000397 [Enterococcus pernyi]|uniref:Uncharacterized protein n=1 Tax=Enterococcus mundtii TaxID=53346 RepID=A0A848N4T1_ENTMU|nr:hypothetical protein [Enterococcus mundtii]NMP59783.1 hypothetical protein [Enterococcus mundtii]
MKSPRTKDEYMRQFQESILKDKKENEELNEYLTQQFEQLDQLTRTVSPDNFWENIPRILGIDAKLTLMAELIRYDYQLITIKEMMRIVETDYRTYFKELFENNLSVNNTYSMVYNVI